MANLWAHKYTGALEQLCACCVRTLQVSHPRNMVDDTPIFHSAANRYAYGLTLHGHIYVEDR